MEHLLGLIRIRIQRGINLVKRDCMNSDPYVVVCMGKQKLKTRVVKKNINPKWEDDLTLCVADANLPIKLYVYDKDTFSFDDKMGDAWKPSQRHYISDGKTYEGELFVARKSHHLVKRQSGAEYDS